MLLSIGLVISGFTLLWFLTSGCLPSSLPVSTSGSDGFGDSGVDPVSVLPLLLEFSSIGFDGWLSVVLSLLSISGFSGVGLGLIGVVSVSVLPSSGFGVDGFGWLFYIAIVSCIRGISCVIILIVSRVSCINFRI